MSPSPKRGEDMIFGSEDPEKTVSLGIYRVSANLVSFSSGEFF